MLHYYSIGMYMEQSLDFDLNQTVTQALFLNILICIRKNKNIILLFIVFAPLIKQLRLSRFVSWSINKGNTCLTWEAQNCYYMW